MYEAYDLSDDNKFKDIMKNNLNKKIPRSDFEINFQQNFIFGVEY